MDTEVLMGCVLMTERENLLKVFHRETPAWLPLCSESMLMAGGTFLDMERPHAGSGIDWFGCKWAGQNEMGGIAHPDTLKAPVVTDITKWREQAVLPNLDALDWQAYETMVQKDVLSLSGRMLEQRLEHTIWERLILLMGFENALEALLLEPEACMEYANAMADFRIDLLRRIMSLAQYELITYMDDYCSIAGPLMSLDTWRAIFKEPIRRIGKEIHRLGALFAIHCCGKCEMLVEDFIEIGADVIDPLQTCNNQEMIKKNFGELVVFQGGLNNQAVTQVSYPEESAVRAEMRRAIDTLAPGGGYIIKIQDLSCAKNGLDVKSILIDEYNRYGKNYYV